MLKNGRPYHLPQLNLPYTIVLDKLDNENINYSIVKILPSEDDDINSSQHIVYSNNIGNVNIDDNNPIWIADNNICDGHHRYFKGLFDNK